MKPQYIVLSGTTPKTISLDTSSPVFDCQIDVPAGVTVQVALEDSTGVSGSPGPTWVAAPAAVNGIITLRDPYRMVLLTPTTGGQVTITQGGLSFA